MTLNLLTGGRPKGIALSIAGLAALLLPACVSLAPDAQQPSLVADIPESFQAKSAPGDYQPAAWWRAFDDPVLDSLVDDALTSNLDIAEAAARVAQASAQARLARSALLPSVNASGAATSTSTPIDGLAFGNLGGGIDRIENEAYTLDLGASYELDLFGRARNDYRAGRLDAVATARDLSTVRLAAAAETISAYFDYVDLANQITLTEQTIEILRDRAARTDDRFARGLAESFELYQIRQDLRATEASLPQLRSGLVATQSRLALLTGTYPGSLTDRLSQTLTPRLVFEPVPTGLPVNLLSQRPDIAANWSRLEAARLRIGARKAERFPSLSLSGSLGTQAGDPAGAFDFANNWASSLAASIVAPVFDGGRISANIATARATYDAQAAAYARSVISAFGEVESALSDYEQSRQRYLLVTAQLAEARGSLDLQSRRFSAGVGSYSAYLDAARTVTQGEIALSSAARSTALARLGVHRALGGDWVVDATTAPVAMEALEEKDDQEGSGQ